MKNYQGVVSSLSVQTDIGENEFEYRSICADGCRKRPEQDDLMNELKVRCVGSVHTTLNF